MCELLKRLATQSFRLTDDNGVITRRLKRRKYSIVAMALTTQPQVIDHPLIALIFTATEYPRAE